MDTKLWFEYQCCWLRAARCPHARYIVAAASWPWHVTRGSCRLIRHVSPCSVISQDTRARHLDNGDNDPVQSVQRRDSHHQQTIQLNFQKLLMFCFGCKDYLQIDMRSCAVGGRKMAWWYFVDRTAASWCHVSFTLSMPPTATKARIDGEQREVWWTIYMDWTSTGRRHH